MTNCNERLDGVLEDLGDYHEHLYDNMWLAANGEYTKNDAKQAILRWVADEVIGEDEEIVHHKTMQANNDNQIIRNSQRQKQRNILARHGYKGGE